MRDAIDFRPMPASAAASAVNRGGVGMRLFTAVLRVSDADGVVEILHACRVGSAAEVRARLAVRLGSVLAARAVVHEGMDPGDPIAVRLMTGAAARRLAQCGDLPGGALAGGGDLHILQRRDR